MPTRRLTLPQQAAVWAWISVSVSLLFARGSALGLDRQVAGRLRVQAIPVAVSVLYHGRVHDYTAFRSVAATLRVGGSIGDAIFQAIPPGDGTYYWAADDRGMADHVMGAFALFGPRVESLYLMYFVLLAASLMLFLALHLGLTAWLDDRWTPGRRAIIAA